MAAVVAAAAVTGVAVASGGAQSPRASADRPAAPWQPLVARAAVPAPWAAAWDRAANRRQCALLFPTDAGAALTGAQADEDRTQNDRGWDIVLSGPAGSVEILGLFGPSTEPHTSPGAPLLTRRWADGSVARYGADAGDAAPGTFDPDTTAVEAVLTIPGQRCGYHLYDTLGRAHLETLFDRLRLMRG